MGKRAQTPKGGGNMIHAPCATTSLPNRRGKAVDLDSPAFVAGGLATRAMGAIGKICPVAPVAAMADPGAKPRLA
jgi:hypothetical protein